MQSCVEQRCRLTKFRSAAERAAPRQAQIEDTAHLITAPVLNIYTALLRVAIEGRGVPLN